MLYRSGRPTKMMLLEDNVTILKIIYSILYYQNSYIPETLAAGNIFAIAITIDKYNYTNTLRFTSEY